jgi:hypothetical protein
MTIGTFLILAALSAAQPSAARCSLGEDCRRRTARRPRDAAPRAPRGNAELMAPGMADQMVLVSNGNLLVNSREKMISFFKTYFARVKYLEWSDTAPALVNVLSRRPDGLDGREGPCALPRAGKA